MNGSPSANSPPSANPKSCGASTESSEGPSPPGDCQRHPPPQPTTGPGTTAEVESEESSDVVLPVIPRTFTKQQVRIIVSV